MSKKWATEMTARHAFPKHSPHPGRSSSPVTALPPALPSDMTAPPSPLKILCIHVPTGRRQRPSAYSTAGKFAVDAG